MMLKLVKRTLTGIVVLVVLIVAALYLARFRPGAALISVSVDINAPPEHVWELISSAQAVQKWVPELIEVKNQTPGKTGPGARDRVVMLIGGERTELVIEVAVLDRPRRLELEEWPVGANQGLFRAHITYVLEPIPGGTRLTESSKSDYTSALFRLIEPIITRSAAAMLEKDMQTLKAFAEKQP
jgi:uncharacterized protein YndB with AHSA1/START domain